MPAQPERAPENQVPVQFKYEKPVPAGSQVQVQYSADGKTWEFEQLQKAGNAFTGNVSMPEGANYKYKFLIVSPDGALAQFDPPSFGATLNGTAGAAEGQAAPAQKNILGQPSRAPNKPDKAPIQEAGRPNVIDARQEVIRRRLQGRVKDILGAGRSYEGVESLDALFEQIDLELQEINHTGNVAPIILGILNEEIGNLPNLPAAVRDRFKGKNPPQSYDELAQRFSEGGTIFRRKAFNALRTNPAAQKALGIKPGSNDFSDPGMRKIFGRVCNEFDMWETIPFLGMAFNRLTEAKPANDPELTKQRTKLLKGILGRLKPRDHSAISKVSSNNQALALDIAVNTGYVTAAALGSPLLAGAVWLGGGVAGGLTGVHLKELMQAMKEPTMLTGVKNVWGVIKKNNIFSQWSKSQEGLGGLLKNKMKGFLWNSIPFYGSWRATRPQDEEPTFAPDNAKVEQSKKPVQVEDIMREACKKELGN